MGNTLDAPKVLTAQHRRAAQLFALGMSRREVAAALGAGVRTVVRWRHAPGFAQLVEAYSDRAYERMTAAFVEHLMGRLCEPAPPRTPTASPTGYRAPTPPSILPRPAKARSPVRLTTTWNGDAVFADQRWTPEERAILQRLIASGRLPGSRSASPTFAG
jgi:hypothetical protein